MVVSDKSIEKIGIFDETIIDIVYRLVGNNWYSILLNEKPKGLFRSHKGLK